MCDIADKDEHVHAPNIEILGHGDDEAVHDDRGDDGSVAAGEKDHHVGDEGVLHRTLNDSAHRADIFHSTVSATNRDHQWFRCGMNATWANCLYCIQEISSN